MERDEIWRRIKEERERQDAARGVQIHPSEIWYTILGEETGQVGREVLNEIFEGKENITGELIQMLAVGVAWLESRD